MKFHILLKENIVYEIINHKEMKYTLAVNRKIQLGWRTSSNVSIREVNRALNHCKSGMISYYDPEILNRAVFLNAVQDIRRKG